MFGKAGDDVSMEEGLINVAGSTKKVFVNIYLSRRTKYNNT